MSSRLRDLRSNHAGGMLGGISSGQPIVAHLSLKPTSSIQVPGRTIDVAGNPVEVVTTGGMIRAWDCGPCRSPRRCWRSC